ncbi:MAG: hypothetical protein F4Y39_24740 [Gemmatimonadetes bacterium]|nr:hypothetical protein [Gemmatimonadota bacterium]MYF79157.1 hypothetical protein [Chloroflexota bacterium]
MSFFLDVAGYLKTAIDDTIGITSVDQLSRENVDDVIGRIYSYMIQSASEKDLRGKVLLNYSADDPKKFRAWMITRTDFAPSETGGSLYFRDHTFALYPYYALAGAGESEMVFQDHLERVADLFDSDIKLGGHTLTSGPMSVSGIGHRMWLSTLCHSAQITFTSRQDRRY